MKFKESVESGHFIPEEIRKKLEEKIDRTPQEEEILQKEKQLQSRKEKVSEIILSNIFMACDFRVENVSIWDFFYIL